MTWRLQAVNIVRIQQWAAQLWFPALLLSGLSTQAQTNNWINTVSGKWEIMDNWSIGLPNAAYTMQISNAGTKVVAVDFTTSGNFQALMSMTNLIVSAPAGATNLLLVSNALASTFRVHENLYVLKGGRLLVTNSTVEMNSGRVPVGNVDNGSHVQFDSLAMFNGAYLNATNAFSLMVGGTSSGTAPGDLRLTNSLLQTHKMFIGYYSDGAATFANSTNLLSERLTIADVFGHTGAVSIIGGSFTATNLAFGPDTKGAVIGGRGSGQLTVSNATVQLAGVWLAPISGSSGTLNLQAGTMTTGKIYLGADAETNGPTAQASVVVTGGQLFAPELHIGYQATGSVAIAAGLVSNSSVYLSESSNSFGSLAVTGGVHLVSSLLLAGGTNAGGQVAVTAGGLFVTNASGTAVTVMNRSTLIHAGGVFKTDNLVMTNGGGLVTFSNYNVGWGLGTTNTLAITNGTLVISNATFGIGNSGSITSGTGKGLVTLSNASVSAAALNIGSTAGGLGVVTLQSNATVTIQSNLTLVSSSLFATSSITVGGGSLTATNGIVSIGQNGSGELNLSGGTTTIRQLMLGGAASVSSGKLTVSGTAHLTIQSRLSANSIIVGGGDLDGSGGTIIIGEDHDAAMTLNAGNVTNFGAMYVGFTPGFTGTYTQNGGLIGVKTNLVVGDCLNGAYGIATLNGGAMYVTNAAHNAVLDVRSGLFALNSGATLVVDKLVVTNSCGHFMNNGGALVAANIVLSPNFDADGDGQSNTNEFLAGTDPLNPASNFRLLSIVKTNAQNLRLDWTTVAGHNYVVQRLTNSSASVTGQFVDVSPVITFGGTGEGTTNWVQVGSATNRGGYYRVRLGP